MSDHSLREASRQAREALAVLHAAAERELPSVEQARQDAINWWRHTDQTHSQGRQHRANLDILIAAVRAEASKTIAALTQNYERACVAWREDTCAERRIADIYKRATVEQAKQIVLLKADIAALQETS